MTATERTSRRNPFQRLLIAMIRGYQMVISPLRPASCRYQPTCSQYALEALTSFGLVRGSWLAVRRLSRCHPWHRGGFDPVPPQRPAVMLVAD